MYRNPKNFYKTDKGIEELAGEILMEGLLQPLVLVYEPCDQGAYKIIAGERRWKALQKLVADGHEEFAVATCKVEASMDPDEEQISIIIANSYRDKSLNDTIEEYTRLKESLQKIKTSGRKIKGYDLTTGRLRNIVADMMQKSPTNIANLEAINNHLIPEVREVIRQDQLTISAAYELSKMSEQQQAEVYKQYQKTGSVSYKEVKAAAVKAEPSDEDILAFCKATDLDMVMGIEGRFEDECWQLAKTYAGRSGGDLSFECDPKGLKINDSKRITWISFINRAKALLQSEPVSESDTEGYTDPEPEKITSLCYSCDRYEDCTARNSVCTSCNTYVDRREARKTEQQKYDEAQEKIDRETKKKLAEIEKEKQKPEPAAGGQKEKELQDLRYIRVTVDEFNRIEAGKQHVVIEKRTEKNRARIGQEIVVQAFSNGFFTGLSKNMVVSWFTNDTDSSALQEGYQILDLSPKEES